MTASCLGQSPVHWQLSGRELYAVDQLLSHNHFHLEMTEIENGNGNKNGAHTGTLKKEKSQDPIGKIKMLRPNSHELKMLSM